MSNTLATTIGRNHKTMNIAQTIPAQVLNMNKPYNIISTCRNKHIPFTARAKKSLELGLRQAIRLGDTRIGSEHLLLGVLDEGSGLGVRMLRDEGVDLAQLRATTVERSRRSA